MGPLDARLLLATRHLVFLEGRLRARVDTLRSIPVSLRSHLTFSNAPAFSQRFVALLQRGLSFIGRGYGHVLFARS